MTGRTYLDCYGSLADTAVAEDGNFEEHSWWGSLFSRFGIKQKSRFGLSGGDEKTHHLGDSSGSLRRKKNERVEFRCCRQKTSNKSRMKHRMDSWGACAADGLCALRPASTFPPLFSASLRHVAKQSRCTIQEKNSAS